MPGLFTQAACLRSWLDVEAALVNPYDGTFYRLIIQAKCAYGYGSDWTRHSYRYLSHRTGNKFQADVLCDEARQSTQPTYPLYIFYNPAHTCSLAGHSGCSSIEGVNLANGYLIRSLATTGQRRLSTIRHYVLNLSDLLCQPANESEIPRPVDVRNYLLFKSRTSFSYPEQILREMGIVVPPDVGTSIPDDIQAIIDRSPREREPRPFSGWRVIFISSSPPERTRE